MKKSHSVNMFKILCVTICAFLLTSCAPKDPSINDLTSPCVAVEFFDKGFNLPMPCVRRSPAENSQFV